MTRPLLVLCLASSIACFGAMVDPIIDAGEPFGYLGKPSTVLGVKAGLDGSQVTFDGAIYTGFAELCFLCGEPLRPVMVRNKSLADGWMPIVTWAWRDGGVAYNIEAFGASLDGEPTSNTINFIQVRLENLGDAEVTAPFAAALRHTAGDHRCDATAGVAFDPDWRYEMSGGVVTRGARALLWYPEGAALEAVPGTPYTGPFTGRELQVSERAEVCMARFAPRLAPGQSRTLTFRMPLFPVDAGDANQLASIAAADHDEYLARTVDFWHVELRKGMKISVPERKVLNTHRASLMYDLVALDIRDGDWVQTVNEFQYDHFWLRDGAYIIRTYDMLGHHETAEKCLEYFLKFQREDGLFSSQSGQLDGFGQALFALGQHYMMTRDLDFANRVYKHIPPAIEWLKRARAADEYRLMPPTNAHDNENIQGRYTGHNFLALLGVRNAILLARATGHDEDASRFQAEYDDYHAALMKRLDDAFGKDGYISPGLDVEGGQDWGNLLGVYPSAVLDPWDPRITTTWEKMHRDKYAEGIMTYYSVLHHYVTTNVTQTHIIRGEQEQALRDFYALLLHTGATQEGFELGAQPWGNRDVGGNYPPHGWFAAQFNAVLRNMLIQERGGDGGLGTRDLHLFSVISPEWAKPGEEVSFRDAPTEMGKVSASMKFAEAGAVVTIEAAFERPVGQIVVHVPYFAELQGVQTDARSHTVLPDRVLLSPDATTLELAWTPRQVEHQSFDEAVRAYKAEYARRYAEYTAAGGKPIPIEAPKLLSPEERASQFEGRWGPQTVGLAFRKPVTISGGTEQDKAPERAVDGNASDRDGSSWWAGPPAPRWLQVDLQQVANIDRVQVFPYWDGGRYYQYTVQVSVNGQSWTQVADMSANKKPASPEGDTHRFAPVAARYVRVTLLSNSANPSVHLVELRVFAAK